MKKILFILLGVLLVGCSIPKDPVISFGKKCIEKGDLVFHSFVWVYGEDSGISATKEACELIDKTKSTPL